MTKTSPIIQTISFLLITITMVTCQSAPVAILSKDSLSFTPKDTTRHLNLPARPKNAMGGAAFAQQITGLSLAEREKAVVQEILSGNVPAFSRPLKPLKITQVVDGKNYELIFFTTSDYLAIGSAEDYFYIPMTPSTAQYLADQLDCVLPTQKIVDVVYQQAAVQLTPQPIPPSEQMTTVPVFIQHTDSIKQQILQRRLKRSADQLMAGHKKDIILSNKIYSKERASGSVVIYGWHLAENKPIQPVYNGHHGLYADYSHGTRLIAKVAFLNGAAVRVEDLLKHPDLFMLLSEEGVISQPNYPKSALFTKQVLRQK